MKKVWLILIAVISMALKADAQTTVNGIPNQYMGSSPSPIQFFVPDTWASGTVSGTTPVTIFTAGTGLYYHILFISTTPNLNISIAAGGTSSISFGDNGSAVNIQPPLIYGPATALTTFLSTSSWTWNPTGYGYRASGTAHPFTITLGTALTTGTLAYTVGYCTSQQ